MLNEIWSLSQTLSARNIIMSKTHKHFKRNKRSDGFRLFVNQSGELSYIELLGEDLIKSLGRFELANGQGFPTFNLSIVSTDKEDLDKYDDLLKKIDRGEQQKSVFIDAISNKLRQALDTNRKDHRDIEKRLYDVPNSLIPYWASEDIPLEFNSIKNLINALVGRKWNGMEFISQLYEKLIYYIVQLNNQGEWAKLKNVYTLVFKQKPPFLLEFDPINSNCFHVTSEDMATFLNHRLLKLDVSDISSDDSVVDSLSGFNGELENRFPSPGLPILGKSILLSNPKDLPCQHRYGLSEGKSFFTTTSTGQALQDAINTITNNDRKNKCWSSLPADFGKGVNLLIVYPEQAPVIDLGLAEFLAHETDDSTVFDEQSTHIIEGLQNFREKYGPAKIKLFILSKPDPGRTQIYLTRELTDDGIKSSLNQWKEACTNFPPTKIFLPLKIKGEKGINLQNTTISPITFLKICNLQFIRNGTKSSPTHTASLRDVYELFLSNSPKPLVDRLLRRAVYQFQPLLVLLGAVRSSKKWEIIPKEDRFRGLNAMTILGILLYFSGRRMENFKTDRAYNLGKLLQCADIIHREYCIEVRNGGDENKPLPISLNGQSLFNTAMSRPSLALEQLGKRLLVYQRWAENSRILNNESKSDKRIRTAKWALKKLKEASEAIPRGDLIKKFNEKDRAELLLGYLSQLNTVTKEEE